MTNTRPISVPEDWQRLRYHPYSELVEFGAGIELDALIEHMNVNGYDPDEPIILIWDERSEAYLILDGRHRHQGATRAGVVPTFSEFVGTPKAALELVMKKLLRQHLTPSERAMVAAKLSDLRRIENPSEAAEAALPVISQDSAAAIMKVSPDAVQRAKAVIEHGTPELQAAVLDGTVSVTDAAKVANEATEVQNQAVAKVRAGDAKTAAAAVSDDAHLCLRCQQAKRANLPTKTNCPDCAQIANPPPPAKKPRKKKRPPEEPDEPLQKVDGLDFDGVKFQRMRDAAAEMVAEAREIMEASGEANATEFLGVQRMRAEIDQLSVAWEKRLARKNTIGPYGR